MTEIRNHPNENPLESWKEIAAYLNRDVRTVQRWEQDKGLPVHRIPGRGKPTVYALKAEVDAWWLDQRHHLEEEERVLAKLADVEPSLVLPEKAAQEAARPREAPAQRSAAGGCRGAGCGTS